MDNGRINASKCDHCGKSITKEGHDGCMGTLQGNVMNACCGHGNINAAYVQFDHEDYHNDPNRYRIDGKEALDYIERNKDNETDFTNANDYDLIETGTYQNRHENKNIKEK